jgi:hypothetical protein
MFKRIFSFGCSYTSHSWPTWSDIIAYDLQLPYENWGLGGLGNFGIQARIVECDFKHTLNEDDLVMILWSGWNREDRFRLDKCGWLGGGYIFNNPHYDKNFLAKHWTLENDLIRNITIFHTTRKAYKDIVKFEGEMTSPYWGDEYHHNQLANRNNFMYQLLDNFENKHPRIPRFDPVVKEEWNEVFDDSHPTIKEHRTFVQKYVYPKLNLTMKQSTIDCVDQMHDEVLNTIKKNHKLQNYEMNERSRAIFNRYGFNLRVLNDQYSQRHS